jgi:hypothetical protein
MIAWNIIMELMHVTIVHKASEQSVLKQKDVSSDVKSNILVNLQMC